MNPVCAHLRWPKADRQPEILKPKNLLLLRLESVRVEKNYELAKDGKLDQVIDSRFRELLILLRKISHSVDLHSKYLNKRFGLTGPQLILLKELSDGEMTVSELATRISLSQGTVTEIIQRLELKDLVIKRRSIRDKRRVLITLSEKCKALLALAPPPLQEKFTNTFSQIDEWEQLMILSAMNRLVDMMSADEMDAPDVSSTAADQVGVSP